MYTGRLGRPQTSPFLPATNRGLPRWRFAISEKTDQPPSTVTARCKSGDSLEESREELVEGVVDGSSISSTGASIGLRMRVIVQEALRDLYAHTEKAKID